MDFMALFTMETGGHYITMLPADWSASTSHDPLTSNCHSEKMLRNPSDFIYRSRTSCLISCYFVHRKKFQSFGDHKLRVCQDSRDGIEHARLKGKLHEALLDRREKMKADRYCK